MVTNSWITLDRKSLILQQYERGLSAESKKYREVKILVTMTTSTLNWKFG